MHPLEKEFSFSYAEEHIITPPDRITIIASPLKKIDVQLNQEEQQSNNSSIKPSKRRFIRSTFLYRWIKKQCTNADNRYAFQMAVAFIISTLFVVIDPISDVFPNTFWVGVSVVTVLDNTVGGFLSLSIQRLMGTLIGGVASIISMTITRAAFHPKWGWEAIVLLCFLLFLQVFFIAKLKTKPNMAYTGGIGLLTTIIVTLSGYSDLIHNRISFCAELGAWRTLNLMIGIVVAMIVSFFVFPLKASKIMRKNIGKAIEDAADLYEKATESYISCNNHQDTSSNRLSQKSPYTTSTAAPADTTPNITEQQMLENFEDNDNKVFDQKTLKGISTGAYKILTQLQTESNRLKNVSTEYAIQTIFHFFGGGKQRCQKDLRRAKRYNQAIDAMKHIVWPLTSFRLLLPLVTNQTRIEEVEITSENQTQYIQNQQLRYISPEILACFADSISVMRQLAVILKERNKPLSSFLDEWAFMDRMVTAGSHFIQRELRQLIKYTDDYDNIRLLSYYGFLVRCSVIWEGLRTILDKLSPLNGTLSRASSLGTLPNREPFHVTE
ncbi:hypothetical protein K501DRAFT_305381 [Backusella circina FSU 941]|nr:hypothetical protein K501DRAFT_305381 [Backusella circina FSU 941]